MSKPRLNDPNIEVSDSVVEIELKGAFPTYKAFLERLAGEYPAIEIGWRYYNDGKSWLGKAVTKKKTVFWLSIWDGSFKTSFFFTEKTIAALDDGVKAAATPAESAGKLIPIILETTTPAQLDTVFAAISYKVSVL